ncbi:polyamine aminopropyltransferase [Aquibacillus koreensis]|uniref:Polyamine aminopropyltransferase n=1 Tax=Aquibacillus koreensis TaxID=279446 RepID=A0A9X3WG76_9BACI|nr:polyamine aminopropyltransferase [Aquibacillus koreensis]MCT2534975.1 polyamine aminopropyltransferase [Aquibacillus koreensis]MDC3419262.1 polyamine aminopropyltransferase [Aquibacillus koreensis]
MDQAKIKQSHFIYWASGIVSICGIIFEVLFGALGSYILGDGVKQYTLTISLFLTGMGIGASLSEKVTKNLVLSFVYIEFMVALIGGFSSFLMFGFTAFSPSGTDALFLYGVTLTVGALTGVELPILIRKANEIGVSLNRSTARVLFSDYAGGLIGGLLFVFLLRPQLGIVKTAFLVGLINLSVALVVIWLFRKEIRRVTRHFFVGGMIGILLLAGLLFGEAMALTFEQKLYKDPIIHMEESEYQKIILTRDKDDVRLYLNGGLQLSSIDEYRYHEVLVHPPMALADEHDNVLVLGGGDGLAVKELLKYEDVKNITLVDLDPAVVDLANNHPYLLELNEGAIKNKKVEVINQDAFQFLEETDEWFDVIIVDLPDPNDESLNKLYTKEFYSLARNHLVPGGAMMIQATSPVFAREVYWTISTTVASTGLYTENLHVDVPSFGNWGFVFASRDPINLPDLEIAVPTRFLTTDLLPSLATFGKDEGEHILDQNEDEVKLRPNTLIDPILIQLYEKSWENY